MTVAVTIDSIPDRSADQDEAVIVVVLRRTDPANVDGGAAPDVGGINDPMGPLTAALLAGVQMSGFDPAQSYLSVASVTDTESGGAITAADLAALIDANSGQPEG